MSVHETSGISQLAARRTRVALRLTAAMMVAYFGFVLLVAFDKPLMGRLVGEGGKVSVGVLLGAAVILLAPILTGVYVRWANQHYDRELSKLRAKEPQ
jgi:uncharacterized membrane protein (DUF485 family)